MFFFVCIVHARQSLGIAGAGLAVYDFVLFPRLVQRLGIVTVQRASAILAIPVVLAIPNSKAIAGEAGTFELFVFLMFILACCTSAVSTVISAVITGKFTGWAPPGSTTSPAIVIVLIIPK